MKKPGLKSTYRNICFGESSFEDHSPIVVTLFIRVVAGMLEKLANLDGGIMLTPS
jgi:hypothetical protein